MEKNKVEDRGQDKESLSGKQGVYLMKRVTRFHSIGNAEHTVNF